VDKTMAGFKQEVQQVAGEALSNPAVQKAVVGGTIGSGLSLFFEVMPIVLGLIATIMGITASYYIIKKSRLEAKLASMQIKEKMKKDKSYVA
jgi:F0F1-type ATP synthase assembly protein I